MGHRHYPTQSSSMSGKSFRKTSGKQSQPQIKVYQLHEFYSRLDELKNLKSFSDRLAHLQDLCQYLKRRVWQARILLDGGASLLMTIDKDVYTSHMVPGPKNMHWYVELEDESMMPARPDYTSDVAMVCQLRTDLSGYLGELVWLAKGDRVPGSQVLDVILHIESALKLGYFFLYDDSRVTIQVPASTSRMKEETFFLRVLYPIIESEETIRTWYQKKFPPNSLLPTFCRGWTGMNNKTFDQDPQKYKEAIKYTRDFPLQMFKHYYPAQGCSVVQYLTNKYIPKTYRVSSSTEEMVKIKTSRVQPTVHHLSKAVYQAHMKEQAKRNSIAKKRGEDETESSISLNEFEATLDFVSLCNYVLNPMWCEQSAPHVKYSIALMSVYDTQIFEHVREEIASIFGHNQTYLESYRKGFMDKSKDACGRQTRQSRSSQTSSSGRRSTRTTSSTTSSRTGARTSSGKRRTPPKRRKAATVEQVAGDHVAVRDRARKRTRHGYSKSSHSRSDHAMKLGTWRVIEDKDFLIRLCRKLPNYKFTYGENWCRYCGAKTASSYSKSPWGSRKLCTPHYVRIVQNQRLDIGKWNDPDNEPKKPINPKDNSEDKFMNTILKKNGTSNIYAEIEEYWRRKDRENSKQEAATHESPPPPPRKSSPLINSSPMSSLLSSSPLGSSSPFNTGSSSPYTAASSAGRLSPSIFNRSSPRSISSSIAPMNLFQTYDNGWPIETSPPACMPNVNLPAARIPAVNSTHVPLAPAAVTPPAAVTIPAVNFSAPALNLSPQHSSFMYNNSAQLSHMDTSPP